jgi:signal transduction histidine kinase
VSTTWAAGWPPGGRRPWAGAPAAALCIPVGVVQVVGSYFAGQNQHQPLDALAFLLVLVGPVALAARRRFPVPVLAVTLTATVAYLLLGYPYGPIYLSLAIAFFSAVIAGHRTAAWLVAGAGFATYFGLLYLLDRRPRPTLASMAAHAAWLLVVLVVAEVIRIRREQIREAQRTRLAESRRQASDERLRIARDLHDVLGHHISLINVQAGVALHLIDEHPEQARTALSAIKQASSDALREMRSVLGVLRQADEEAPRQPAPSLSRLDDLVSRTSAAGITVRAQVHGQPRPLPAGIDSAAYRVVQEALTNVSRHAPAATATVQLSYGARELIVQVDDDGRGGPSEDTSGSGSGIPGMRERAAALGGRLEAGRMPYGGFRIRATFPLDGGE